MRTKHTNLEVLTINPKSHQKAAAILYNIYWHDWFYTQANEFQIFFFRSTLFDKNNLCAIEPWLPGLIRTGPNRPDKQESG